MNINGNYPLTDVDIPENFLSHVYIARCPFDYKLTCSSPTGEISDFNVWNRSLTEEEALEWTTCKNMQKGNLLDWSTASFNLENMYETDESLHKICKAERPGHVMFPEQRSFDSQLSHCRKFGAKPSLISNNETMMELIQSFSHYPKCAMINDGKQTNHVLKFGIMCLAIFSDNGWFYAGWWDEPKEGIFTEPETNNTLLETLLQPWYLGEPNGDIQENCAAVSTKHKSWKDISCSTKLCSFCELKNSPSFQIRGLCPESKLDSRYSWTNEIINGHHCFRGFTDSLLFWSSIEDQWKILSYTDETTFATLNSTKEYPFGNHHWTISGDSCDQTALNQTVLNFNACSDNEFNCNEGTCVDIEKRCDGRANCPDGSDEVDCNMILTDDSYLKDMPPQGKSDKLKVFIAVNVLAILEISEVENFILLQLELKLSWNDNRLTMANLKDDKDLNTLTPELRNKIWMPEIVFYNTQKKLESLNDDKAFAIINRHGNHTKSPNSELQNAYFYRGSENPITISRVYDAEFICDFNMAVYPFDTQKCSVVLILKGNRGKFVQMMLDEMNYLGPIDLAQYFVKETKITEYEVPPNIAAVKVDIVFGRRLLAAMLTTYLPTILICLVAFSTNYFKPFFFEALVTVNLTSLLVLTE